MRATVVSVLAGAVLLVAGSVYGSEGLAGAGVVALAVGVVAASRFLWRRREPTYQPTYLERLW